MRFCTNCGNEIKEDARFCSVCGNAQEKAQAPDDVNTPSAENNGESINTEEQSFVDNASKIQQSSPKKGKIQFNKKSIGICGAILAVIIIAAVVIGNAVRVNNFEKKLQGAYDLITYGATSAESYSTLQSKVWRNCIYENKSTETDKYTKNSSGRFYSDFNDALKSFYDGEYLTYNLVQVNVSGVGSAMSELKSCPKKLKDEYTALKELYIGYSELTDLVVGDSSYSWNTFNDALESAKSSYKSALSAAKVFFE